MSHKMGVFTMNISVESLIKFDREGSLGPVTAILFGDEKVKENIQAVAKLLQSNFEKKTKRKVKGKKELCELIKANDSKSKIVASHFFQNLIQDVSQNDSLDQEMMTYMIPDTVTEIKKYYKNVAVPEDIPEDIKDFYVKLMRSYLKENLILEHIDNRKENPDLQPIRVEIGKQLANAIEEKKLSQKDFDIFTSECERIVKEWVGENLFNGDLYIIGITMERIKILKNMELSNLKIKAEIDDLKEKCENVDITSLFIGKYLALFAQAKDPQKYANEILKLLTGLCRKKYFPNETLKTKEPTVKVSPEAAAIDHIDNETDNSNFHLLRTEMDTELLEAAIKNLLSTKDFEIFIASCGKILTEWKDKQLRKGDLSIHAAFIENTQKIMKMQTNNTSIRSLINYLRENCDNVDITSLFIGRYLTLFSQAKDPKNYGDRVLEELKEPLSLIYFADNMIKTAGFAVKDSREAQ